MQLAGAGAGAVGGTLLGRASENNKQGAQGAGVQDLGGLGAGGQPGGDRQNSGQLGGQAGGQSRGPDQQPPAAQISNVLNGGNRDPGNQGFNGNGGNGRGAGGRDSRGNTGDPGGRSAADIAATSPQSNVFRQDARTAATHPRESHCPVTSILNYIIVERVGLSKMYQNCQGSQLSRVAISPLGNPCKHFVHGILKLKSEPPPTMPYQSALASLCFRKYPEAGWHCAEDVAPPQRGNNLLQTNIYNNDGNRNYYHYGSEDRWRESRNEWDRGHGGRDSWCAPPA